MARPPIRVALLGYDGVQTLDLAGPLDVFSWANTLQPGAYATVIVSLDGASFASSAGLRVTPDCALAEAGRLDTLILPGGGLRRPGAADRVAQAVREQAAELRRIVSVCTGIYGLAPSGLADGRRVTTHWDFAADVSARFPALRVEPDAIFIKDGPIYTSAGVTAAIDLSLALVQEDYGDALALSIARGLVVYLKRCGGQRQYSEPLHFQTRAGGDRLAELAAWMVDHLDQDLSVETLAARACLSPRQFNRRFKAMFGVTPGQQVEALRLDTARNHLIGSNASLARIANQVGFNSEDAFRRAFERRFGLPPSDYRARFAPHDVIETARRGNASAISA